MTLAKTPTKTNAVAPPEIAAVKTPNFAVKPLVNGIPANDNINRDIRAATSGDYFPRPFQRIKVELSPACSLIKVSSANAPTVANA